MSNLQPDQIFAPASIPSKKENTRNIIAVVLLCMGYGSSILGTFGLAFLFFLLGDRNDFAWIPRVFTIISAYGLMFAVPALILVLISVVKTKANDPKSFGIMVAAIGYVALGAVGWFVFLL